MPAEAALLRVPFRQESVICVMDERGRVRNVYPNFANPSLEAGGIKGRGDLCFVLAGQDGIDKELRREADHAAVILGKMVCCI